MKNTDILGGGFAINDNSIDPSQEEEYESDPKVSSTDTSEVANKNKVYALNDDGYDDENDMSYENDLMPEDEDGFRDNISEDSGLSELSNEELYF